jgi:hypothetical protein
MSYNSDFLVADSNFTLDDKNGIFGKALLTTTMQSALADSAYQNRDVNLGYPIPIAERANDRRKTQKVVTIGPAGVVVSSVPEPRMVTNHGSIIDRWTDSLAMRSNVQYHHELLSWDSPRTNVLASYSGHVALKDNVWGLDRNSNSPTFGDELIPDPSDVRKILFEFYKLPQSGIISEELVSVADKTSNDDGADYAPSSTYGPPVYPAPVPGVGEVWMCVAAGLDTGAANVWYLRVRVDRAQLEWQSLESLRFEHTHRSSELRHVIPNMTATEVRVYAVRAENAWKEVFNVISPLASAADESFMPSDTGKRDISGGFTRQGVSIHDVYVYGWPEFALATAASGVVVWNEGSRSVEVTSGVRQIEWLGSRLRELETDDDEATVLTQQERDDMEEIAQSRIKSSILTRVHTVSSNPVVNTDLYRDAEKADVDLMAEVVIQGDPTRDLPEVTMGQANKKAANKTYSTVHVIDKFGSIDAENAVITFRYANSQYSADLKVNGATVSIEAYEDFWRYVWAGALIIDKSDGTFSFLQWLMSVTGLNSSDVELLDEHGDGENNDWNETTIWPRWIDPSKLSVSARNAQEIMQFSRDRSQLSHFLFASIGQGKLAWKNFKAE